MHFFARTFFLAWLPIAFFISGAYVQNKPITKAFLLGKYDYTRDTSFIRVAARYSDRVIFLKKETYRAYQKMYAAAIKDGVKLNIISGTRSFNDQCYKWESKWNDPEFSGIKNTAAKALKLLRWWSMPGTSRHHWGTDIDLTNIKLAYFNTQAGKKMYTWMLNNAARYGFYQPFNANRTTGYQEEKWHWSYLPLASIYLKEYIKQVTCADITGFDGCKAAKQLDIINARVLAINPVCRITDGVSILSALK